MSARTLAVILIWTGTLANAVRQGLVLPELGRDAAFRLDAWGIIVIALPLVIFSRMGLRAARYPLDVSALRARVNRRWGDRAYEAFLSHLKPLLLLSTGALVAGTVALGRSHALGMPEGSFVVSGFFVSAGLGLLAARALLGRRRVSLE